MDARMFANFLTPEALAETAVTGLEDDSIDLTMDETRREAAGIALLALVSNVGGADAICTLRRALKNA